MSSVTSVYLHLPTIPGRQRLPSTNFPSPSTARNVPSVLRRRHRQSESTSSSTSRQELSTVDNVVVEALPTNGGIESSSSQTTMDSMNSASKDDIKLLKTESNTGTTSGSSLRKSALVASPKKPTGSILQAVEFSFLDNKNICCGMCGEIVLFDQLMTDHLPNSHPEIFASGVQADGAFSADIQRQQRRLKEKLSREKQLIETGFKMTAYRSAVRAPKFLAKKRRHNGEDSSRRVSAIRVNPRQMPLAELEDALRQKMYEKLNRRVPVTLMDRIHARCGICNAIISLNKKFEIIHLVRHFNCWHPTVHVCSGSWPKHQSKRRGVNSLSIHDFAVVDIGSGTPDSLQCIWCGMFVESHCLAQHFGEVHTDDVEVPKCNLCMQELIITARLQEKFSMEIQITLPDEHHMRCSVCGLSFSSELSLETHVQRRHVDGITAAEDPQADEDDINLEEIGPEAFSNSRMTLGKRRRPKRQFIMPALRQAVPLDSQYVEPIAECHWKCKLCEGDIYGAVISAAAIRHYKYRHPDDVDKMQYEICKSRLEKISDGCMEFVHPQLIECLLCQQSFNLHQPFNMCRAIRHLKSKHPNLMPEYAGLSHFDDLEAEEESANAAHVRRTAAEGGDILYDHQDILHTDLAQAVVSESMNYTSKVAQSDAEESEEIIMAAGGSVALTLDGETSSLFTQQFVMGEGAGDNSLSTSLPYSANKCDFSSLFPINDGIRVVRPPHRGRYSDYGLHNSTTVAAKNAQLDHGAIFRQMPSLTPSISVMNHQMMHQVQPHIDLDQQVVEPASSVVFPQQQQQRQYYLLLQTNADGTLTPAHSLLDSPMVGGSLTNDRRSVISLIDDPMIEAHRITELMTHTHSAMTSSSIEDRQPHALMAGDDPF